MNSITEIGNIIALKRMELGYTQEDLAELIGCQPNSVSRWENGETTMKIDVLQKIALVLNLSTDSTLGLNFQKATSTGLFENLTEDDKISLMRSAEILRNFFSVVD